VSKAINWSVFVLMAGTLLFGCAFLKSIGRTVAVAGGGAAGAVVGLPAGPPGMILGAAGGAGTVYAMQENSELREGTLQGDGARGVENDRLKSLLLIANGDLQLKERALAAKQAAVEAALAQVEDAHAQFEGVKVYWRRLLLAGLITRNLLNFPPLYRALVAKKWLRALHWIAHIFLWPWRPKE
jgi:hypothetical protein